MHVQDGRDRTKRAPGDTQEAGEVGHARGEDEAGAVTGGDALGDLRGERHRAALHPPLPEPSVVDDQRHVVPRCGGVALGPGAVGAGEVGLDEQDPHGAATRLQLATARQRPPQRDLVGVIEVASDGQPAGEAGDGDAKRLE